MSRQFHNKRKSLTVTGKQAGVGFEFVNQKNFTSHMFSIKLEEKSFKISFKALPVKIQRSDHPGADRINLIEYVS